MSRTFGAAFGAGLALVLLAIYAVSAFFMVYAIGSAEGEAIMPIEKYKGGFTYVVTTVGGLVSALVIAQLSVTKPGTAPAIGGFQPTSGFGIILTNTVIAIYLVTWVAVGVACLVVGVMWRPDVIPTVSDIGTTWLGLAVSAGYAYFGLDMSNREHRGAAGSEESGDADAVKENVSITIVPVVDRPKHQSLDDAYKEEVHGCPDVAPSANECAVRLSKSLISCGVPMDADYDGKLCRHGFARGAQDLGRFLEKKWGKRDMGWEHPNTAPAEISGKKGVLLFANVPGFSGQGHIDLWDGSRTRTGEYWKANPIWFWETPA